MTCMEMCERVARARVRACMKCVAIESVYCVFYIFEGLPSSAAVTKRNACLRGGQQKCCRLSFAFKATGRTGGRANELPWNRVVVLQKLESKDGKGRKGIQPRKRGMRGTQLKDGMYVRNADVAGGASRATLS